MVLEQEKGFSGFQGQYLTQTNRDCNLIHTNLHTNQQTYQLFLIFKHLYTNSLFPPLYTFIPSRNSSQRKFPQ